MSPAFIVFFAGGFLMLTDEGGLPPTFTVNTAFLPFSADAVIVALPDFMAFTLPFLSTDTILGALDFHVSFASEPIGTAPSTADAPFFKYTVFCAVATDITCTGSVGVGEGVGDGVWAGV
jgi:hypothetical protein